MNKLWRGIAWFLSKPAVFAAIKWWAFKRPYFHIGEYMHRWWVVPESWKLPFAVRLHHIKQPDADPYLHDHPWNWRTVVLHGWYAEETVFGDVRVMMQGMSKASKAETFHTIVAVSSGGVWTLFITGRCRNRWGFMTINEFGVPRKVHHKKYNSPNGRGDLHKPVDGRQSL